MTPSPCAVALIKEFEGCRLTAYRDVRGIWTIGWGHTGHVQPGQCIDQATADDWLSADLETASNPLQALGELTQMEFDALAGFIYNVGVARFLGSTLRRKLLAGDFKGAAAEFDKWIFALVNGVMVEEPGLIRRRSAERALFESMP